MKVLMLYSYAAEQADRLRGLLSDRWQVDTFVEGDPPEALPGKLLEADVLLTSRIAPDLPPTPRLKLIQSPVAGCDKISPARVPANCPVCNVYEHEIGIGEYALATMLEWTLRLGPIEARFRAGDWTDGVAGLGPTHGELYGKTLGIVGVGHIGHAIAERAKGFGMKIVGVTRTPREEPLFDEVHPADRLDKVLPELDFIVLACPLTAETRDLIDARRLALCKETAVIMNLSRGHVVAEEALYDALVEKRIGGAILDVWYSYPERPDQPAEPSRFPFRDLDNVIVTPHCSGWSDGLLPRRWKLIAQNLENVADGEPLVNEVDLSAL